MSRSVASKWEKTKVLLKYRQAAAVIPDTRKYRSSTLKAMLKQYGSVVAKPCVGAGGHGVMMITRGKSGYSVQYYGRTMRAATFPILLGLMKRLLRRRLYLLQRTVKLAEIGGRPVDYRVKLVQQDGRWIVRAVVARVARKRYFVTNLCRGGQQLKSDTAIRQSLHIDPKAKKREMVRLSYICTEILARRFPGIDQLGFDYGIDKDRKIWLFEVNTKPQ